MKKFISKPPILLAIAAFSGIIFLYIHDRVSHPHSRYFIGDTSWLLNYAALYALEVGLCVAGIIRAFKSRNLDKTKILLILLSIATLLGAHFNNNQLPVYHSTSTPPGFIFIAIAPFALLCAHITGFLVSVIFHISGKLKRQNAGNSHTEQAM